jgi:hypothetical protein
MNVFLGRIIVRDFVCHTPGGTISDADATPSCAVFEDATDTAILNPTPVKRTGLTGHYRVAIDCTDANGFEISKSYNVVISATVSGTPSKAVIASFVIENITLQTGAVVTDAGNSPTSIKTDLAETTADYHKDALMLFTSGALINQVKKVTAYNGSTKVLTTGAFTGTASATDRFILLVY